MDAAWKVAKAFLVLLICGVVAGASVGAAVLTYKFISGLL